MSVWAGGKTCSVADVREKMKLESLCRDFLNERDEVRFARLEYTVQYSTPHITSHFFSSIKVLTNPNHTRYATCTWMILLVWRGRQYFPISKLRS